MKICFVTTEFPRKGSVSTGLPNYIYKVSKGLESMGHEPIVLTIGDTNEHTYYDGIEVYRKSCKYNLALQSDTATYFVNAVEKGIVLNQELKKIIKKHNIEMIQFSNLFGIALFYRGRVPAVLMVASYAKKVYEHSVICSTKEIAMQSWLERSGAKSKGINGVLCPSNVIAKAFEKDIRRKVAVIETPVSNVKVSYNFEKYLETFRDKKYILFYGSICDYKGIFVICKMIRKFLQSNPEYYFALIGNSLPHKKRNPMAELYNEAGRYRNRIIHLSAIKHEYLFPIIENADFIVLPSLSDNLPNSCIEAMSLGKIVVGTEGASFEQLITDGYSGFLARLGSAKSLLDKVQEAVELPLKERKVMGARAIERIDKLKPEITVKKLVNYYSYIKSAVEK